MMTGILSAYAVSAVAVALFTVARTFGLRPLGRETDRAAQVVLVLVGLVAGAAWALFVPVYLVGWLRSPRAAVTLSRASAPAVRAWGKVLERGRHRLAHWA